MKVVSFLGMVVLLFAAIFLIGCTESISSTGVGKATADIKVQSSGLTVEQENIKRRIEQENEPGAIKHLYIISSMTGDVILHSTVDGKVTSSGKRLTPYTVEEVGFPVRFPSGLEHTQEVLQDDGTYGSSIPYLYWWDTNGIYHQHYPTGSQIVHVSEAPLSFPRIILDLAPTNDLSPPTQ